MNRSTEINELAGALAKAQGEMKAAPKSASNPHFKSKYAPLNEVIDVATAALAKHGLSFIQPARVDDQGSVVVETTLLHASGQWVSESLALRPQQNTPQGVGSCITYGRRFGLSSLVGIAADEDDDGNAASKPAPPPPPVDEEKAELLTVDFDLALREVATAEELTKIGAKIKAAHAERKITDENRKALLATYKERLGALAPKAAQA